MRITAGKLKGKLFDDSPSARTHPMSDKLKNALFNALGDIEGLKVLDMFGGTGALAFEAVSRGAESVTICENDKRVAHSLRKNLKKLGLGKEISLLEMNVYTFIRENERRFDLIVADPPYSEFAPDKLQSLSRLANSGAILVISMPSQTELPKIQGFEAVKTNLHGNAALAFYRAR